MANYVKPKSQNEKRIDAGLGGGGSFYAGEGLSLINGNQFVLNVASQSGLGGIYIMGAKSAVFGEEDAAMGIYKESNFAALRTATQTQKGGFFLGDGLVPVLKETTNSEGEKAYTFSDTVQLRLGDGLYFKDNSESPGSLEEERENDLGGRKVAVRKATKEAFGIVKLGALLDIDEEGRASVILTAGNGIDISPTGIVAVRVDGESVKFNEEGLLESRGVEIQNAVVIQETDAKYLLHEYTEVDYIAGNEIVYSSPRNQIVVQGYVLHNDNLISSGTHNYEIAADVPDFVYYQEFAFNELALTGTERFLKYEIEFLRQTADANVYRNKATYSNSEAYSGEFIDYGGVGVGLVFFWREILPPGSEINGQVFPYGYVVATWGRKRQSRPNGSTAPYEFFKDSYYTTYIGFASEAEYNAAVGLTYEPNTLTEVQETITEV